MANLTANAKNFGQITLNTQPHSDPYLRHKKTSRFTFWGKIHFVLGLLVRDKANHSYYN